MLKTHYFRSRNSNISDERYVLTLYLIYPSLYMTTHVPVIHTKVYLMVVAFTQLPPTQHTYKDG